MDRLHYHLVDVFTNQRFGGNQLAVFTDGRGVAGDLMQTLAKEMNLSESTFILPPDDPANDYHIRIFTPGRELPMAGHPTVGTSYILAREGKVEIASGRGALRLEEGVGPISVTLEMNGDLPGLITMQQPMPTFGPTMTNRDLAAGMLSLSPDDLDPNLPVEIVSCGVPFLYIPLTSLRAIQSIKLRMDLYEQYLTELDGPGEVFVFTSETVNPDSTVHSRMFAPGFGIPEDPATGAASGPLGCYLVKYGVVTDNPSAIISEQGFEMGRPSIIHIGIERSGEQFTRVSVGGECVYIGAGYIEV
jgi:trans-2,3-dihydro-3-hydroxyanthranilate isomerase